MAKGSEAKAKLAAKMAEMFGENWIGEVDKKYYVWSEENGERIQIAIAMTCPKTPIGAVPTNKPISTDGIGYDFENMPTITPKETIEYTQEEKDTINRLIAELGL